MDCTYVIHVKTVPKMLCPLDLLSQAPQNMPFKTWSYSQKLLEIKLSIVEGETWKHMLVRGRHILSIFSSSHSIQASSVAIHNLGSRKKYLIQIVWAKCHQFLSPSLSGCSLSCSCSGAAV